MPASQVYAWFPDGRVERVSPEYGFYRAGGVHPGGSHAVFWGGALGPPGVWQTNLATGRCARLTSMVSGSWDPSYGPRGERIVFVSDRFGQWRSGDMDEITDHFDQTGELTMGVSVEAHLFVMLVDGRGVRALTSGPHRDREPALSPDGKRVAFASNRGGEDGLWTVATAEGATPEPLVRGVDARQPAWSPDGGTVYFAAGLADGSGNGGSALCAVPAQGGEWRTVVESRDGAAGAPFADFTDAGGKHLLAHIERDGRPALYEFPLDGGEPRAVRPPGFEAAARASRARNGVTVFDAPEPQASGG